MNSGQGAGHPVDCKCLGCLLEGINGHQPLRLVTSHTERVIDARVRIYGRQLRELVDWFEAQEMSLSSVEQFCTDARRLADRMEDTERNHDRRPSQALGRGTATDAREETP